MTSYFSFIFLAAFLPAVVVLYAVAPRRTRWVVLLIASYAFFFWLSRTLILALWVSTLSIYLTGLGLGALIRQRDAAVKAVKSGKREIRARYARKMKLVLAAGLIVNFGLLAAFKYLAFFGSIIDGACAAVGIPLNLELPVWAAPIGISFYTLMAGSYLIDVFRGTVAPDRNLGRVALFLGYFPQIMEGPICRYGQTADALMAGEPVTRPNLYAGSLRMLWGLAKKMIVADRLNAFVKPVFADYTSYDGTVIAVAAVLYTLQLYCDFSGTMDVALGMSRIFDISLPENFRQPFFSRTASGFWQRWHITLGTWLRDYIYYPVSLSKPMKKLTSKARKRFGNRYGPLLASSAALFVRMARQRPVARCGLAVHLLRYVLLRAHCVRQPHRSDGSPSGRAAAHQSRVRGLSRVPDCAYARDHRGGRAVLPRRGARCGARHVRRHVHRFRAGDSDRRNPSGHCVERHQHGYARFRRCGSIHRSLAGG